MPVSKYNRAANAALSKQRQKLARQADMFGLVAREIFIVFPQFADFHSIKKPVTSVSLISDSSCLVVIGVESPA